MKTVYKYPVNLDDRVAVEMPVGATILSLQMQNSMPCLWCLVDPGAPREHRSFRWFGTGHPIEAADAAFVGTIQAGPLVFHLFEVRT